MGEPLRKKEGECFLGSAADRGGTIKRPVCRLPALIHESKEKGLLSGSSTWKTAATSEVSIKLFINPASLIFLRHTFYFPPYKDIKHNLNDCQYEVALKLKREMWKFECFFWSMLRRIFSIFVSVCVCVQLRKTSFCLRGEGSSAVCESWQRIQACKNVCMHVNG